MLFTGKQKLVIGGAILFAALFVVGSYFGSHWYYGDIEPVPEHLLTIEPRPPIVSQETPVSGSQDMEGLESLSVAETGELSGGNAVSTPLADITDNELDALLQELDESPDEKGDFPEVPDGFPSDLTPVWIEYPDYKKGNMYEHEMIYRVLIKLWNQGDHDFVNGVYNHDKVYPLYRDVLYVGWKETVLDTADGPLTVRFVSRATGTHARSSAKEDMIGGAFSFQDFITGDYKTRYPGLKLVEYEKGGYNPETFLADD